MKIIKWVFLGVALCTILSVGALLGKTTGGGYHLLQPPAPTPQQPHPAAPANSGTFRLLVCRP